MPRVPTSAGPELRDAPLPNAYLPTPDVTAGARGLAQGLAQIGEVADRRVMRDAETAAFNVNAAITSEWLQFDADARTKYRGTNVDQYNRNFDTDFDKYTEDAVAIFTQTGLRTVFENLEGFPEDWQTNPPAFARFVRASIELTSSSMVSSRISVSAPSMTIRMVL